MYCGALVFAQHTANVILDRLILRRPDRLRISQIINLSTLSFSARIWPMRSLASLVVILQLMTALLTPHARPRAIFEGT